MGNEDTNKIDIARTILNRPDVINVCWNGRKKRHPRGAISDVVKGQSKKIRDLEHKVEEMSEQLTEAKHVHNIANIDVLKQLCVRHCGVFVDARNNKSPCTPV